MTRSEPGFSTGARAALPAHPASPRASPLPVEAPKARVPGASGCGEAAHLAPSLALTQEGLVHHHSLELGMEVIQPGGQEGAQIFLSCSPRPSLLFQTLFFLRSVNGGGGGRAGGGALLDRLSEKTSCNLFLESPLSDRHSLFILSDAYPPVRMSRPRGDREAPKQMVSHLKDLPEVGGVVSPEHK